MTSRVVAVVPARMASSRFPGKPLVPIAGLAMVEHVRRRAALVEGVDEVVVATCDEPIRRVVTDAGGRAVMTADTHQRCTDRVEEAARSLVADIVVIVQGDEPLLLPDAVRLTIEPLLREEAVVCTNLLSVVRDAADLEAPDMVKAACARNGDILYLTRAKIPFHRATGDAPVYRQTGIMALRRSLLGTYTMLSETPLEGIESIDMLRLLEHGYPIRGVVLDHETIGVDRPQDVARIERSLREDPAQRALLARTLSVAARA